MPKIEMHIDKNGKLNVDTDCNDLKFQNGVVNSFCEYQAKVEIETQKTIQILEKTKQTQDLQKTIVRTSGIILAAVICLFVYLYFTLDSDEIKKYKIEANKNQHIELNKIEKEYLLSMEKMKIEANQTK